MSNSKQDINSRFKKLNHWATLGEIELIEKIKAKTSEKDHIKSTSEVIREALYILAKAHSVGVPEHFKIKLTRKYSKRIN